MIRHRLFIPQDVRQAAPLLVALHGCTQNAADFAAGTRFDEHGRERRIFVLYPEQSRENNPEGCWNWFLTQNQSRESGEPAEILEQVEMVCRLHPIDRSRIFVAGLSAGGAMAAILAEQAPDIFSAVGIMAGVALRASEDVLSAFNAMGGFNEEEVPLLLDRVGVSRAHAYDRLRAMIWTGKNDQRVNPSNAGVLARQFARLLELPDPPEASSGEGVDRLVWRDADHRARVESWQIERLGHAWSGGSLRGSHTAPTAPDASGVMLDFFLGG